MTDLLASATQAAQCGADLHAQTLALIDIAKTLRLIETRLGDSIFTARPGGAA